tara:strand:+ start:74 stop:220 length:147 start_codon:yes stop_codon:yes gene_type:complete
MENSKLKKLRYKGASSTINSPRNSGQMSPKLKENDERQKAIINYGVRA